jgi:hypothetical protein
LEGILISLCQYYCLLFSENFENFGKKPKKLPVTLKKYLDCLKRLLYFRITPGRFGMVPCPFFNVPKGLLQGVIGFLFMRSVLRLPPSLFPCFAIRPKGPSKRAHPPDDFPIPFI